MYSPMETDKLGHLLCNGRCDLEAAFLAVGRLHAAVLDHPKIVNGKTVGVLRNLLEDHRFDAHRQSYFLYRSVADTLSSIVISGNGSGVKEMAVSALKKVVETGDGPVHRAACEAMGSLPIIVEGPRFHVKTPGTIPRIGYGEVVKRRGWVIAAPPRWMGRSLVAPLKGGKRLYVVKFATDSDSIRRINREAGWMEYLRGRLTNAPGHFHIPVPLAVRGGYLFRMESQQETGLPQNGHLSRCGIGYIAHSDYFAYPNDHRKGHRLKKREFKAILSKNARLLGHLTGMGIVHTAPIPLFHNRLQRVRRRDRGLYEWHRGGRLDRWLHSCRYPNFARSGLRDFEHLLSFRGSVQRLYRYIGDHLLSLILVIGSYFRGAEPRAIGFDASDKPADARHLFDPEVLTELLKSIFESYYKGFTGKTTLDGLSMPFGKLAERMIEEMGVDRHMVEILRVREQERMTPQAFANFLSRNDLTKSELAESIQGKADIPIRTGPHLGEFNGRISLPEVIHFLNMASAYCIAGRYLK